MQFNSDHTKGRRRTTTAREKRMNGAGQDLRFHGIPGRSHPACHRGSLDLARPSRRSSFAACPFREHER